MDEDWVIALSICETTGSEEEIVAVKEMYIET